MRVRPLAGSPLRETRRSGLGGFISLVLCFVLFCFVASSTCSRPWLCSGENEYVADDGASDEDSLLAPLRRAC